MKSHEKELLFTLLKTASDNYYGYSSPEFNYTPSFTDDKEESNVELNELKAQESHTEESQESQVSDKEIEKNPETGAVTLETIAQKISDCRRCTLCNGRKNAVPGMGVTNPLVLVIGEAPGEEEDLQGLPFVGPAGQLLDKMLAAISLDRKCNCYIANIVKCRPPKNRTPFPQEADSCSGFLQAQIHILKPRAILAMGRTAVQNLMKTEQGINSLRGKILDLNGIPLLATYHPSALLRDQSLKRPAWDDLKIFRSKLEEICPEYSKPFDEARKEN